MSEPSVLAAVIQQVALDGIRTQLLQAYRGAYPAISEDVASLVVGEAFTRARAKHKELAWFTAAIWKASILLSPCLALITVDEAIELICAAGTYAGFLEPDRRSTAPSQEFVDQCLAILSRNQPGAINPGSTAENRAEQESIQ
jgi:hypothetical protein